METQGEDRAGGARMLEGGCRCGAVTYAIRDASIRRRCVIARAAAPRRGRRISRSRGLSARSSSHSRRRPDRGVRR